MHAREGDRVIMASVVGTGIGDAHIVGTPLTPSIVVPSGEASYDRASM